MVDTKLTDLTELGEAVADTDVIYGVNVSSGASAKILASRIKTYTSNSPTLVTPALGTPSSGTLTNCTGLPVGGISATGTPGATTYLRGDGSWQTVSAGATPGGSDTQVQFNDGGSALGGDAGLTYNKTSNDLTITGGGIVVTGNISAAAWTTNGIRFRGVAGTLTDTSSTGTVAAAYTNAYGGNTIAASNSTTFTNYYTTFITQPTAGTNVTFTNRHALGLSGSLAFSGDVVLDRDASDALAQRRGTTTQTFRIYNTWANSGTDYERGSLSFRSNIFRISTEKGGTGSDRGIEFYAGSANVDVVNSAGESKINFNTQTGNGLRLASDIPLTWSSSSIANGASPDTILRRDAAGVIAQRNSTNAQTFRVYNTYTDASNYERGFLRWNSNVFEVGTEAAGTGTARALSFVSGTGSITIPAGTVTTSQPALDITQTWNAGAVTFTGLKFNVTDTASASGSLLLDIQVGGASRFRVDKSGGIGFNGTDILIRNEGSKQVSIADRTYYCSQGATLGFQIVNASYPISWGGTLGSNPTLTIYRDADDVFAQRRSTNAQTFRVYRTFTDASNYQRMAFGWNTSTALMMNEGAGTGADGSVAFNDAALATTATKGFIMIPSCAGAPTGVPDDIPTGQIPIVFDSTNNKLYVYDGGWLSTAALT